MLYYGRILLVLYGAILGVYNPGTIAATKNSGAHLVSAIFTGWCLTSAPTVPNTSHSRRYGTTGDLAGTGNSRCSYGNCGGQYYCHWSIRFGDLTLTEGGRDDFWKDDLWSACHGGCKCHVSCPGGRGPKLHTKRDEQEPPK